MHAHTHTHTQMYLYIYIYIADNLNFVLRYCVFISAAASNVPWTSQEKCLLNMQSINSVVPNA